MPIILAPVNKELRVLRVLTDEKTKKHLENLGLTQNGTVTILSSGGGAVVCKIKEGRLALDPNISRKILVAEA